MSCVDRQLRPVDDSRCQTSSRPDAGRNCFRVCGHHRDRYRWSLGAWSTCRPKKGDGSKTSCPGIQQRNVTCEPVCHHHPSSDSAHDSASSSPFSGGGFRSNSEPCETFERRPPTERPCRPACVEDCVTTDFGPWSQCLSCSVRNRTRHRAVLVSPVDGGLPCTGLVERQPCPPRAVSECRERAKDVYRYRLGRWTDCSPLKDGETRRSHKGTSVFGSRWRTAECIDPHGNTIDMKYVIFYCFVLLILWAGN